MIMDSQEFLIPLNGLTSGRKCFCWNVGKKFFEDFGNAEILDASLDVEAQAEKCGREILVDGVVSGSVTVRCDRCMEDLELPVRTRISLEVRYGSRPAQGQADGDGADEDEEGSVPDREIIFLRSDEKDLDMRQIIYDYVCLSLPMQRFHEEGRCNPSVMEVLSSGIEVKGSPVNGGDAAAENPFSALQDIFKDKEDNNN